MYLTYQYRECPKEGREDETSDNQVSKKRRIHLPEDRKFGSSEDGSLFAISQDGKKLI